MTIAATVLSLLVDGISFGMLLFLISAGLTVTLGIMRIVNLAHCGFAMVGGYLGLFLVRDLGLGLLAGLALAVAATMAFGAALERTIFRWVYGASELGQILMTIGLAFIMVAGANALFGSSLHAIATPDWLSGTLDVGPVAVSRYRALLMVVSAAIAGTLWLILEYSLFGAKLRAAVDNPSMARCVGIDVPRVFAVAFAAGCGLAAVAGVLGTQLLPLEPWYALKYLVLVLMVVAVGGLGSLKGSLQAALLLGTVDTFSRYYLPAAGAFMIYVVVMAVLLVRPRGLHARA